MAGKGIEPYLATYLHQKGGSLGLPIGGTFELTSRCNFRCPMCYIHSEQNDCSVLEQELSAEQWISLARQARDSGMVFALLTGGEPFLRKDFFEIYHAMKAMGLMVSINTNGSLLEGECRRQLLEDPPFRVNVSLYGGCGETYRRMCGQDAFERVVENIRALKMAGVDVRINLSITPYNRADIQKIFAISQELNVHVKASSYMYPPIRLGGETSGNEHRLSFREAAECAVEWDRLRFSEEEFTQRAQYMNRAEALEPKECAVMQEDGVRCRAGHSSFWIAWDGTMMPCGMMPEPVAKPLENGFEGAWRQIRDAVQQIRTPAECAGCPKREICGVCAAVCKTETGSFCKVPEYMCGMTEEIMRLTCAAVEKGVD